MAKNSQPSQAPLSDDDFGQLNDAYYAFDDAQEAELRDYEDRFGSSARLFAAEQR